MKVLGHLHALLYGKHEKSAILGFSGLWVFPYFLTLAHCQLENFQHCIYLLIIAQHKIINLKVEYLFTALDLKNPFITQ